MASGFKELLTVEDLQTLTGVCVIVGTAKWCKPCQTYKPFLAMAAALTSGINYFLVDADTAEEVLSALSITKLPTTVVMAAHTGRPGHTGQIKEKGRVVGAKIKEVLDLMADAYGSVFNVKAPLPEAHPGFEVTVNGNDEQCTVLQTLFRGVRFLKASGKQTSPPSAPFLVTHTDTGVQERFGSVEALLQAIHALYT